MAADSSFWAAVVRRCAVSVAASLFSDGVGFRMALILLGWLIPMHRPKDGPAWGLSRSWPAYSNPCGLESGDGLAGP